MGEAAWVKFAAGIFVAITAGVVLNLGSLLQKKAVNQMLVVKKRSIHQPDKDINKYPISLLLRSFFMSIHMAEERGVMLCEGEMGMNA